MLPGRSFVTQDVNPEELTHECPSSFVKLGALPGYVPTIWVLTDPRRIIIATDKDKCCMGTNHLHQGGTVTSHSQGKLLHLPIEVRGQVFSTFAVSYPEIKSCSKF